MIRLLKYNVLGNSYAVHRKSFKELFELCLEAGTGEPHGAVTPEEELLSQAVVVLSCASYRNQALHVFIRPALLASAIHAASSNQKRETDQAVFKRAALCFLKLFYTLCYDTVKNLF